MAVLCPLGMKRKMQRSVTKWLGLKGPLGRGQSLSWLKGPDNKAAKRRAFRVAIVAASPRAPK